MKFRCAIGILVFNSFILVNSQKTADRLLESQGWKDWAQWSSCSNTCESELSSRSRECLDSVKKCNGVQKQYSVCNKKNCTGPTKDLRKTECDRQMHIPFRGRRYHWVPFLNPRDRCEVSCKSAHYGFTYGFGRLLKNGIPCGDDDSPTEQVCLHGRCVAVGCDGVVGSGLREDHCGVCGGDNDACRIIKGIYTRSQLDYGYNQITKIPTGACHINITELDRSRNYLVLKYANGTGVINGVRTRMKRPGKYWAAGTVFTYDKQRGDNCPGECLYGEGPTTSDLDIQLLTYRRNPGIEYMFTIPKDLLDSVIDSLSPSSNRRHPSQGRSHGDQTSSNNRQGQIGSVNSESKTGSSYNGRPISYNHQPQFVSPESTGAQRSSGYQALEGRGNQGYGTQDAINRYREGYRESVKNGVSDRNNVAAGGYNSNDRLKDYDQYRVQGNIAGDSEIGRRVNTIPQTDYQSAINPKRYVDSGNTQYQPYYGNTVETRKPVLIVPDTIDEVNFHWTISGFTECSTTCGGGRQDTKVVCMKRKTNVVVTDDNCDPAKKNVQTIICNKKPCPPDWEPKPWSVCSVSCGLGMQTRRVECEQRYSAKMSIPVTANLCELIDRPVSSRSCEVRPCADWRTGNWSKCSVECGVGQLSRTVECVNTEGETVPEAECARIKPDSYKSCDMGTCAKGWFLTGWSNQCTASCGKGYYTRSAYCLAEDGSPLAETKCGKKPRTKKGCRKTRPCGGFWFEGPWTPCSATCGSAIQTRDIVCIKKLDKKLFAVVGVENCKEYRKPESKRACPELPACPSEWFMTKWSQCSKSCGTGIKTRDMKCLSVDTSPSSRCPADRKPSFRRTCNTQSCDLPQLDEDPNCKDTGHQCELVVQSRLCPYEYFKKDCCHSCMLHHLKHKQQMERDRARLDASEGSRNQTLPGS